MSTFKYFIIVLFVGGLLACNTGKKPGATGMFVKQGNVEWEVPSVQTVNDFKQALSAKQRVMVKRLPEYQWQVVFRPDEPNAIWHLSKDGYITRFPQHGDAIYRINFDVERLLGN